MNTQTDYTPVWIGVGVFALGVTLYFLDDGPKRPRRISTSSEVKKRNRPASTLAREESKASHFDEKGSMLILTENQDEPNFEIMDESSNSRSEKYSASVTDLASKVKETWMKPVIESSLLDIQKYPSDYYSLNKKQQWKYRKRINGTNH